MFKSFVLPDNISLPIGNEILSGRTKDLNTSTISKWLNSIGIKVQEARAIPDNEKIIMSTVNEFRKKFNYVFTSGGIGPTHEWVLCPQK